MEPRSYADLHADDAPEDALSWRERVAATLRRPIALALFGVALLSMLALLYLSEVAGVESANARLNALRAQQARLERQEAVLEAQLGQVTSPAYIDQRARALGLAPGSGAPVFIIREPRP